jgi:hypothetical protein
VRAALRSRNATFKPNYIEGKFDASRFVIETNLRRPVGTKGETGVKIVLNWEGKIITAFPIRMVGNSAR